MSHGGTDIRFSSKFFDQPGHEMLHRSIISKQSTFETQVLENFRGPVVNFGASYDDKFQGKNDDL